MKKMKLMCGGIAVLSMCWLASAELEPLDKLMPKMEARVTTNGTWHIWSMAHNSTNWSECTIDMPSKASAESAIADVRAELRMKYEIGKMISDAFKPSGKK